jgi:uncharacterized protein (DUF2267 family)
MKYHELITHVQKYSGFSNEESEEALELMVVTLAIRLEDSERKDFAKELPEKLHDIAMTVRSTEDNWREDLLKQFMDLQRIDENRAKRQIKAAWKALKEAISYREVQDIKSHLPNHTVALLDSRKTITVN